jgi:hypothetical protein
MNTTNFLPEYIEDLNKNIRGLICGIARRDHKERRAIYTRGLRLDKWHHGYSMEISTQPIGRVCKKQRLADQLGL